MTLSTDFRRQFIACRPQLREAAARILGCRQRADDVVQDAYLKLNDSLEEGQVRHLVPYLYRMVRNLAIDRCRRGNFEAQVFFCAEAGLAVDCGAAGPEAVAIHSQHLRLVACALATLPERTCRAFEEHRLGGKTQREVAAQMGISATLVNFMIRDAEQCCRDAVPALAD